MIHDLQDVKQRIDAIVERNFNNKVVVKFDDSVDVSKLNSEEPQEFSIESIECRNNVTIIKVIKL